MMGLLSVSEARAKLIDGCSLTSAEMVSLSDCHNRITADDIRARITQPPFDASAMDGYAIALDGNLSDEGGNFPSEFKLIGESSAGHPFNGKVTVGEAVRIFTGAVVPDGANHIAIQENCERIDDQTVRVNSIDPDTTFIRPAGYDFKSGDVLIAKGIQLNYRHASLLASMNIGKVAVSRRPRVAIIATGDELVLPGTTPDSGQIISSIPYGMKQLIDRTGGEATCLGIALDKLNSLQEMIDQAQGYDILVTIGGASVGDHDLVQQALKNAGMTLDFWKIAMRPGKPLMVGNLGAQKVVGVPGNPVSALICCYMFVVPLIRSMCAAHEIIPPEHMAQLTNSVASNGPRQHYMRSVTSVNDGGQLSVQSLEDQDSSLQARFASANALIVRPPHSPEAVSGELVRVIDLDYF